MDVFTVSCPDCAGVVALPASRVRVLTPLDPGRPARAVFTCPVCGCRESVGVDGGTVDAMRRAGAPATHGHPSLGPPRRTTTAPPFAPDDLLAFHELLDTPDWLERLLGTEDPSGSAA